MRERPILFSAPMVRAILEGRKRQTRRVLKPQPPSCDAVRAKAGIDFSIFSANHARDFRVAGPVWAVRDLMNGREPEWTCPYGAPGDQLWVRETVWLPRPVTQRDLRDGADTWPKCIYSADTDGIEIQWMREHRWKQRPSIHCPRWASRLTLEVTGVRVERLQDIREADALAEGIAHFGDGGFVSDDDGRNYGATAVESYAYLWESINGCGSWDANPWVWVITFHRIEATA